MRATLSQSRGFLQRSIGRSLCLPQRQQQQQQQQRQQQLLLQQRLPIGRGGLAHPIPTRITAACLSYIPMAPPPLFDLCVRRSFDRALERAKTHPHEARFKHPRNWTALHCCVEQVAPLEVVKAIYQAYPENLFVKDWQGITPVQAAVDMETKQYLEQQQQELILRLKSKQQKETAERNNNQKFGSVVATPTTEHSNDPMLLGKVLAHANNLSDQVAELATSVESLQKEIDTLKATLKALSVK